MALENPTFLPDFVSLNPSGDLDPIGEGDDHIRNMKSALRNTFPGMAGRAWRKISRSSSGPLNADQNMAFQSAVAGITLTAAGASVLGNGWMNFIRAPSSGSVTIAAAEKINGSNDPYTVPAGHIALLLSDGVEFYAVVMYESTPATPPVFPAGTRMAFHQTTPPTGWTKLTNSQYNDAAIRMTTGTVGVGGADAFTAAFGVGKSTAGHTLTESQIPPHAHPMSTVATLETFGDGQIDGSVHAVGGERNYGTRNTESAGGGGSHSHGMSNFNIKFVDFVLAEKT